MASPKPLEPGTTAPVFDFIEDGQALRSDTINGPYLVYFYPKDDTPGCTKEACGIRDAWADFKAAGLKVIGVSKDPASSHDKFIRKYELPFPLIPDTELTLAQAFGVYGEKKFMGRIYDSIHRMSFLVAASGTIIKTYNTVKPELHAAEVLEDLKTLQS
ncbi:MAG: peroxiredoxin Q/BCP [Lentimonas sp.]|jgi:peroxiredoxin Q/BCP